MYDLITLVPLFPLIGFIIIGLFGKYLKKEALIGSIASAAVGLSFLTALTLFIEMSSSHMEEAVIVNVYQWISAGEFTANISYQVDQLSILFTMVITGVGFLIHVYSIGYMHGDRSFYRFFAYLNLFIFMMLNLVLASNFLLTFLGWEGVGLSSYLLIGFWYDKKFDGVRIKWTGQAANKAFIVNRIGDFGFLVAMFLVFITFGTLEYNQVSEAAAAGSSIYMNTGIITAITLLIFLGCTGKSAQLPLAVWLPDAMAGPTPVSALIHAATMVTGGVFLVARNSVLFSLAPVSMGTVAIVGAATAILAASVGLVQNDIKKVLAYSTVSQLGFMFTALGVGAYGAAIFHVMTHAFFKALLFLGSGSVIHGMHEEQDIQKMGGLAKYMPTTYKTFMIGTLAISGIPLFAGFFSKDEILWLAFNQGNIYLWLTLAIAAFFTAFYMFRLVYLTFHGKERFDHKHVHPHESPKTMTFPLVVLAILSAFSGFLGIPYALGFFFSDNPNIMESFLHPIFAQANEILEISHAHEVHAIEYVLMALSVAIAVVAWSMAKKMYSTESETPNNLAKSFKGFYHLLWNKYFLDEFYFKGIVDPIVNISRSFLWKVFDVKIIDGIVNGSGKSVSLISGSIRKIQSGVAQNYAVLMMAGIVAILAWLLI